MELRRQISNIFLCNLQRNMNGFSIEEDNERVTSILTRIDDDDGAPAGCALEIWEERRKEETGKTGHLANIGHNFLHFEVEVAQPFMLIRTRRIESIANEQGQPRKLVRQCLSFRA